MKPKNFKQAAQACLDERFYPLKKATTILEMKYILNSTACALCVLQDSRCKPGGDLCRLCPLDDTPETDFCCAEYQQMVKVLRELNIHQARKAILNLINRLEIIAGRNNE